MKVYVNSVTGTDDAIISLRMSKRTWTRSTEQSIFEVIGRARYTE